MLNVAAPVSRSVRRQRAQNGGVGKQRSKQLIVYHAELECLVESAFGFERNLHGDRRGAVASEPRDRGRAILVNRADHIAKRRDFHRRGHAGQQRMHVRLGHREGDGTEVKERMAKCVNPVANHFGDGSGRAHVEIAADDVDANRRAGTEWRVAGARRLCRSGRTGDGQEPVVAERRTQHVRKLRRKAAEVEGCGNRPKHRCNLAADAVAENLNISGAIGERSRPRHRRTHRGGDALTRHRHLEARPCAHRCPWCLECGCVDHFSDRRDAGNRLFRKGAERVGNRADELTVDIHRASAHAGDDTRVCEWSTFELCEDEIAFWSDDVAQDADDMDLELFNFVALPDGVSGRDGSGLDLVQRVIGWSGRQRHNEQRQARREGEKKSLHVVESIGKSF